MVIFYLTDNNDSSRKDVEYDFYSAVHYNCTRSDNIRTFGRFYQLLLQYLFFRLLGFIECFNLLSVDIWGNRNHIVPQKDLRFDRQDVNTIFGIKLNKSVFHFKLTINCFYCNSIQGSLKVCDTVSIKEWHWKKRDNIFQLIFYLFILCICNYCVTNKADIVI